MEQIFTIVEASVEEDKWNLLKEKYDEIDRTTLPSSLLSSYLVQDNNDRKIWRIITVWESLEAMSAYRQSVETPAWILVFQAVNAAPKLIINTIRLSK